MLYVIFWKMIKNQYWLIWTGLLALFVNEQFLHSHVFGDRIHVILPGNKKTGLSTGLIQNKNLLYRIIA